MLRSTPRKVPAMGFGKRGRAAAPPIAENTQQPSPPSRLIAPGIPFVSLAIFFALALAFVAELAAAPPEAATTPSLSTLVAFGGISQQLVLVHDQWWRLFTAPFLHANLFHLLSNGAVLLLTGLLLERVIGPAWYGAIYAMGALAGSIGSLFASGALVSVGASGAIMALLAAVLIWCIPFEDRLRGKRLRRIAIFLFIGALLPSSTGDVDLGAHLGGAAAGGCIGLVLRIIWPETDEAPGAHRVAWGLAMIGLVATLCAFAVNAVSATPNVGQFRQFIPAAQMPASLRDGMDHAKNLVRAYPDDPRAYLLHALSLLEQGQVADAQTALRTALAKSAYLETPAAPDLRSLIRLVLAMTLSSQNSNDAARAALEPGDCARAHRGRGDAFHAAWRQLHDSGICR